MEDAQQAVLHRRSSVGAGLTDSSYWRVAHFFLGSTLVAITVLGSLGRVSATSFLAGSLVALIAGLGLFYAATRDFFHPQVFVTGYLCFAILGPLAYVSWGDGALGRLDSTSLQSLTATAMILAVTSWAAIGHLLSVISTRSSRRKCRGGSQLVCMGENSALTLEALGRATLYVSLPFTLLHAQLAGPGPYGANQTSFSLSSILATVTGGLTTVAVLALVLSRVSLGKGPLSRSDSVVFVALTAVSLLVLGSRSDIIAPVVIIGWGLWVTGKIRLTALVATAVAFALLSNYIGESRTESSSFESLGFLPRVFVDTASPITLTNDLVVLSEHGLRPLGGQTYIESLKYLLPGPVSRSLFGDELSTASFVYRDLIGFDNPDMGFGFSVPSEAFLNFGLIGIVAVLSIFSAMTLSVYRRSKQTRSVLATGFYLLLVATFPYAFRSDSLAHIKMVVYPLLGLTLLLFLVRLMRSPSSRERFCETK